MDTSDQPNSMLHIDQENMYPIPISETESPLPPFPLLCGEGVLFYGQSVYGALVLTNYRLFLHLCDTQHHIPLGLLEVIEQRDLFYLQIGCKDSRSYRLTFDNNEICTDWFSRLMKAAAPPMHLEELFAFFFYVWSKKVRSAEIASKLEMQRALIYDEKTFNVEVERLKFNLHGTWRISSLNKNYKLCGSYPPQILVPAYITDEVLETVAKFRSSRRIPAVVWRHVGNGAVIARCSQPEVGWLGWRSAEDEELIKAISEACTQDRGPHTLYTSSPPSVNSSTEESTHIQSDLDISEKKKVLIMDARSYTTAVANRARGGGCECPEYYPSCEIQFMNLANIHSIRKSYHALRQLCTTSADQPNWFSLLEGTRWLQHMSGLMRAAVKVVTAVERDARPVLVHCSDGWDRTPQIVALAELLLDPFYRTLEGFRILIEREWLAFGHKFADRCGHATGSEDQNERCPVFLQWLDCVHQLIRQFPCAFEFSHTYLVKLAQHTYSNLFGTFLCNTKQERERVYDTTFSVWLFLNTDNFKNHLYSPSIGPQVLWPQFNVRDLCLWSEVYLGSLEMQSSSISRKGEASNVSTTAPPENVSQQHMTKTRSYGDLLHASDTNSGHVRRNSDPNLAVDTNSKLAALKLTDEINGVEETKLTNGCLTPTNETFLSEFEENDCKSDCIYKDDLKNTDEIDHVIEKTDGQKNKDFFNGFERLQYNDTCIEQTNGQHLSRQDDHVNISDNLFSEKVVETVEFNSDRPVNDEPLLYSVCLDKNQVIIASDINHNGEVRCRDDVDSDTECTDSPSENITTISEHLKRLVPNSIETSTETLVSENVCSTSSKELNGFEKVTNTDIYNGNSGFCKACSHIKLKNGEPIHHQHNGNVNGKLSRHSSSPPHSTTPSINGWDSTFMDCRPITPKPQSTRLLDYDGLIPLQSDVQERLCQIIEEHQKRLDFLQKELQFYRDALANKPCPKCHEGVDRCDETGSVSESLGSVGEGQASAVESLRSDMSWEALEEGSTTGEGVPTTLWVPDHAVSKCTGCGNQFWLGRRKHHCRNCGRIFCSDCSENSTPLPSEQLYNPVRVCTSCYSKLRRADVPQQCKHFATPGVAAANNNPHQIAASSN